MHASDFLDFFPGDFKISLVGTTIGDSVSALYFFRYFVFLVYCHNNEPCTLHSLVVRLIGYVSCSQSPATFKISFAHTANPSLHYPAPQ